MSREFHTDNHMVLILTLKCAAFDPDSSPWNSAGHSKWLRSIHAFFPCTSMRRVARSALT